MLLIKMILRNAQTIFYAYLLFLVLAAVLPINSRSSSVNNIHIIYIRLDYFIHIILFLPWVFLCMITFRPLTFNNKLILVGAGFLMAFATEGVQYFLTYRSYNVNDLLANFFGVILGTVVLFVKITGFGKVRSKE
jgi:glycopeptide antibiotics resistance protein